MELGRVASAALDLAGATRWRSQQDEIEQMLEQWMQMTGADGAALIELGTDDEPCLLRSVGWNGTPFLPRIGRAFRSEFPLRAGSGLARVGHRDANGADLLITMLQQDAEQPPMICALVFEADVEARMPQIRAAHAAIEPMLRALLGMWSRLRQQNRRQALLQAALDVSDFGVILIGRHCEISFANETAERLLVAGDGIRKVHGTLRAAHLADGINLHAALGHAEDRLDSVGSQSPAATRLLSFCRTEGPPLIATLHALPLSADGQCVAILHLLDPRIDSDRTIAPLCRLHGLSRVETMLVCRLAEGTTLTEAASAMRIREQTARTYLKQIFLKTGTRRQTELVARMLASLIRVRRHAVGPDAASNDASAPPASWMEGRRASAPTSRPAAPPVQRWARKM